ncbi:hypothetical protein AB3S75_031014 [Citrus x aurantiifolia]
MAVKGGLANGEIAERLALANCLMLLTRSNRVKLPIKKRLASDVFECKTCNRQFPSFQALGGHRASHKKPRLINGETKTLNSTTATKPKLHECSICGQEFAMGQALGGHMRRHRIAMNESLDSAVVVSQSPPVLRRSNSSRRVFGLDLNLTPLENDLEVLFGKMAPKVDLLMT